VPVFYRRSNRKTSGSRRPGTCTVIVNVSRSPESWTSRVFVILPLNLSVISSVPSFTRRAVDADAHLRVKRMDTIPEL